MPILKVHRSFCHDPSSINIEDALLACISTHIDAFFHNHWYRSVILPRALRKHDTVVHKFVRDVQFVYANQQIQRIVTIEIYYHLQYNSE